MISANGTTNGIVWRVNYGGGTSQLRAYNANNYSQELYTSSTGRQRRDTLPSSVHFDTPTIADGQVFVPTGTALVVYGLLNKLQVNAGAQSIRDPPRGRNAQRIGHRDAAGIRAATSPATWSKISGPGTVTFANANSAATTATFSAAGTYVLQLAGSDGTTTINSTTTVTVAASNGPYGGTPFGGTASRHSGHHLCRQLRQRRRRRRLPLANHLQSSQRATIVPAPASGFRPTPTPAGNTNNGYNVSYAVAGDWTKYSANVATTGTYSLDLRVAQKAAGGQCMSKSMATMSPAR